MPYGSLFPSHGSNLYLSAPGLYCMASSLRPNRASFGHYAATSPSHTTALYTRRRRLVTLSLRSTTLSTSLLSNFDTPFSHGYAFYTPAISSPQRPHLPYWPTRSLLSTSPTLPSLLSILRPPSSSAWYGLSSRRHHAASTSQGTAENRHLLHPLRRPVTKHKAHTCQATLRGPYEQQTGHRIIS